MGLIARHPRPAELANVSIEEIARRYVARFGERKPDWHAFADAAIDGYRRAQKIFAGAMKGRAGTPKVSRAQRLARVVRLEVESPP